MARKQEDTAPSASALSRWENEGGAPAPDTQASPPPRRRPESASPKRTPPELPGAAGAR